MAARPAQNLYSTSLVVSVSPALSRATTMLSAANSFQVVFGNSIVSVVFAQRRDYPMFLTTPSSTEHCPEPNLITTRWHQRWFLAIDRRYT
jgi:hypothetical protein